MSKSIFFVILFVTFAFLSVGKIYHDSNKSQETNYDIYNITNQIMPALDNFTCNELYKSNYTKTKIPEYKNKRLNDLICYSAQYVVRVGGTLSGFAIEWGYEHPNYNFNLFMKITIALMIITLIPGLIYLLALLYIIIKWIIGLIRKIFKKNKRSGNE